MKRRLPKWREDFPVDLADDNFIARRDFGRFLVLTSFAFVVGQAWIGVQNFLRKRRGEPPVMLVEGASELPVGGALSFGYPTEDDRCLVVRTDKGWLAYSASCTHLACGVRPDAAAGRLHCPCHHGYFELETGAPLAGPPRRPLPRIRLEDRFGKIHAVGIERES